MSYADVIASKYQKQSEKKLRNIPKRAISTTAYAQDIEAKLKA